MSDLQTCLKTMEQYLKARIPFISIRTAERSRALSFIAQLSTKLNLNIGYHTLSQGMRDISTNRLLNEDRSVIGGLDYVTQKSVNCKIKRLFLQRYKSLKTILEWQDNCKMR